MAVPVIAATSSEAAFSSKSAHDCPVPSGTVDGSRLLMFVAADAGLDVTSVTGGTTWTKVDSVTDPWSQMTLAVFEKDAGASEPGSDYTVNCSPAGRLTSICHRITGASGASLIDVMSSSAGEIHSGAPRALYLPEMYASSDDSLILGVCATDAGSNITQASGYTDVVSVVSSNVDVRVGSLSQASAGTVSPTWMLGGSSTEEYCSWHIVVRSTDTEEDHPAHPVIKSMSVQFPTAGQSGVMPMPYGVEEDDLLLSWRVTDNTNPALLTGFTNITIEDVGAVSTRSEYKVAGASEGSTLQSIGSGTYARVHTVMRITGADPDDPIDTFTHNELVSGTSNTPTSDGITTTNDNALVFWLAGIDDDSIVWDADYPSGYTGVLCAETTEGADVSSIISYQVKATAGAISAESVTIDNNEDWSVVELAINAAPSAASTLVCAVGTFTLTGQAAGLDYQRTVALNSGSFTLTGQTIGLQRQLTAGLDSGSFTLSGQSVGLLRGYQSDLSSGTFNLTGQDAGLARQLSAPLDTGAYSLTGQNVGLMLTKQVALDTGAYSLNGSAATLTAQRTLGLAAGSFSLTGQAAGLLRQEKLAADAGSYVLSGQAAGLIAQRDMAADSGTYVLTGQAALLTADRLLAADTGAYSLTGNEITLTTTLVVQGATGIFTLTGNTVDLQRQLTVALSSGAYTLTGNDLTFQTDQSVELDTGVYTLTGNATGLQTQLAVTADTGTYTLVGHDTGLLRTLMLGIEAGNYILSGNDVDLVLSSIAGLGPGSFALSGSDAGLNIVRVVTFESGSYTLDGQELNLDRQMLAALNTGTYSLNGINVGFTIEGSNVAFFAPGRLFSIMVI